MKAADARDRDADAQRDARSYYMMLHGAAMRARCAMRARAMLMRAQSDAARAYGSAAREACRSAPRAIALMILMPFPPSVHAAKSPALSRKTAQPCSISSPSRLAKRSAAESDARRSFHASAPLPRAHVYPPMMPKQPRCYSARVPPRFISAACRHDSRR